MTLTELAIQAVEHSTLPDPVIRFGIDRLVGNTRKRLSLLPHEKELDFIATMARYPIATHVDAANDQHYELPPEFFGLVLGPHRKYSCCLYETGNETLAEAELAAITQTVAHADLADGQRILELGCGWGSLTLFMAERFPAARITAVSNSAPQRLHIESALQRRGLTNVTVLTADMNDFTPDDRVDRIVSVEMFEHMSNWQALLNRLRSWLTPEGALFLHVFAHRNQPYRFDHHDKTDWIAQHFFTGGIMPSHGLLHHFTDCFTVDADWRWSGRHYARTALQWLVNFDAHQPQIEKLFAEVYGKDQAIWQRRWRLFFLATAGLFGHGNGETWGVSHYRLRPVIRH